MAVEGGLVVLFSYGTLRDPKVQRALFGRLLEGRPDALTGYELGEVLITDPDVVSTSGAETHLIVRPSSDPSARIDGAALMLTPAELATADAYETEAYRRVEAMLASGTRAFVYVASD